MIVVLDTNIWVSALHFGAPDKVPVLALQKARFRDRIAISDELEDEISRVLIERFAWNIERVQRVVVPALEGALRVQLRGTVMGCRDRKDDMFLECAWRAKADLLVAGDKDLLVMKSCKGTRIVTPKEYVGG